jgi:GMP synthase-like glutamine amidotransferase
MRVHIFQHVPFENIGSIDFWLKANGAELAYTRFFESANLPVLSSVDMLVIMGGSMSVHDESSFPWLAPEKRFVRDAIVRGIPVLGICLGAQLIANAMGAKVYPNGEREIGWFPVQAVSAPAYAFQFPPEFSAFHWHGETFDLPSGFVRLARSAACENQAFQLGKHVMGLQFHLETTPELVAGILENCPEDVAVPGTYVQAAAELRTVPAASYQRINNMMGEVLSHLTM